MKVTLRPGIALLVNDYVERLNRVPRTMAQIAEEVKPVTADGLVNEILLCALREGDISKHYTELPRRLSLKRKDA